MCQVKPSRLEGWKTRLMELLPWTELSLKNAGMSWFSLAEFEVLYRREISKKRTGLLISKNKTQKKV